MPKVAVINLPPPDGLARTIFDGLDALASRGAVELGMSSPFRYDLPLDRYVLPHEEFIPFARSADAVLLMSSKYGTDYRLAEEVGAWEKTAFVDGSELGGNNRLDFDVQRRVLDGSYRLAGGVDRDMLARALVYARREKPYLKGMVPLPFGIERRYTAAPRTKKDIDFFCVFGQDEYPILRRFVRAELERYCAKEGFSCVTEPMPKDRFYETLARAKVGISVGGGGFDTFRFWETLGADALLLTETIDIFPTYGRPLSYERIWQFGDLFDFAHELPRVGAFLRDEYPKVYGTPAWKEEYDAIIATHGSEARATALLAAISKKRP